MIKANCWHASPHENVAMWERYIPIGGEGVAVRSTVGHLKGALQPFRLEPTYGEETIRIGRVRYIDHETHPQRRGPDYEVFLYKRVEYRDEAEVRALLSLRMAAEWGVPIPDLGVAVSIDPRLLIAEVKASPGMDEPTLAALGESLSKAGVDCRISRSSLAKTPNY